MRRSDRGRSWYGRLVVLVLVLFGLWATPAFALDYPVKTTADSGPDSLRQAIADANTHTGTDTISFDIPPAVPATGPYTIALSTALPDITDPVTIDGTSQPGWIGPPIVELDGSDVASGFGLSLAPGSVGSTINGLVIGGFPNEGIHIKSDGNVISNNYIGTEATGTAAHGNAHGIAIETGKNNRIGGPSEADRNVISGNTGDGVYVGPGLSGSNDSNVIQGNYLGTDASGANALQNGGRGVTLYSSSNSIAGNLISANAPNIWILGSAGGGSGNTITGNTIGLDAAGTSPLGRGGGILIDTGAQNNRVGGTSAADRNVISGTNGIGVVLTDTATTDNIVEGNWIGTDGAGGLSDAIASANGTGVAINAAGQNTIGGTATGAGNVIAHNRGDAGVTVIDGVGNEIVGNSIFDNSGLAIDLAPAVAYGVTDNDSNDADTGPNNLQNFPVITGVTGTAIDGTLDTDANTTYTIEAYTNAACDASDHGEGQTFLGSTTVTTNGGGKGNISLTASAPIEAGGVTATATSPSGDTSEFSACVGASGGGGGTAPDGSGTLTTPTTSVIAGSTGNTLVFSYTAAAGGMSDGEITVAVPSGWSAPSTAPTSPGYTTANAGTVSATGSTIHVSAVTLAGDSTLTITYGNDGSGGPGATASSTVGPQTWQAQQRSTATGTLTNLASSPSVTVSAALSPDGSGTLTIPFTTATAGSSGNTLVFTYTAATGGMSGGELTVAVPSGWSAPSTTSTSPGYTTANAGTVSVTGSTIHVSGVTLSGGGTFTIAYGDTGNGPGATAPSTAGSQTWQAQQRSTATGTLKPIPSPSVAVTAASSTGDSLTLGTAGKVGVGDPVEITGNSLHLNALPGKADIEIAIDTTGSMGPSIDQAKADATHLVESVRESIPDASFAVVQFRDSGDAPEYEVVQPLTDSAASVQTAISGLEPGGGGDAPEAYNLVFHNSYTPALAGDIGWRSGSRKFVVVIGDAEPHGAGTEGMGITGCTDTSDPDGYNTASELAGMKANERTLFMIRQVATSTTADLACYQSLAAGAYTGGQGVDSGTSLGAQIVGLVQEAASHVGTIAFSTTRAGVTFESTAALAPLTTPATVPFVGVLTVDGTVPAGSYDVTVRASADGVVRASAPLHIVVPLSTLSVSASTSSVGAGIDQVKLVDIPNAWLAFFAGSTLGAPIGSTPVGSTPVGSTPIGSTPIGSTPIGSTPIGSTPIGSTPIGSTPIGSTGLFDLPIGSTPVGSTALSSLLLSQVPLCGDVPLPGTTQAQCQADGARWATVLGTTFASRPLNALSLADVLTDTTVKARLKALPMRDISFATTLFKSVHWSSLLLGSTKLFSLPVPSPYTTWCAALTSNGGSCTNASGTTNVDATTTVLQADVGGQLGSAPVGSTPVGSTPIGSTPVGSTPVGSTAVTASKLATIPLSTISPTTGIIDCAKISCTTNKTLGDAYQANAIVPTATFASTALVTAMRTAGITVNDILIAILGSAGLPWESLPVQGLQPYSLTQPHVTYTISAGVNCSALSTFSIGVRLPDGFFPVNNTAKLSLNGGSSKAAGAPDVIVDGGILTAYTVASVVVPEAVVTAGPVYKWTLGCGGVTGSATAVLTFDSFVGLRLGTFSTDVAATVGDVSIAASGGPVKVGENGEPANNAFGNATTIAPNTLVVGHIGANGDQDFYKLNLTGLPRGTKVSVFLNVPGDSDFDLTVSKPAAPSFFSSPIGSTPIGSTPIEDTGIGFSTTGQAVPSETLQDIPVGSTPVGSTPVGSTPVGSTSTNRGDVNEVAQIITAGESGVATIGISGYNGASSGRPYVLRVQQTPPPPLPASCPARPISVKSTDQGTLPATLPATTQSLFILNKQRLTAMYGKTAVANLLNALSTLSARQTDVAGSVLTVDGNAAVRNAYAAWDASPCDVNRANGVVRAINDVVASYRTAGLPKLHYIVLLGTDEAIPMARTSDPVTLSPEENAAAELAFTTNGLTTGNALYTSAAQNNILTDGAYGAFTSIPWLGHDLLLPQISISRLVETPTDMVGQINRYLGLNGLSAPQTAAGTLNPTTGLVTGYDFLADGAAAVAANLRARFGFISPDTIGTAGHKAINLPGSGGEWTAGDLTPSFLGATTAPAIASINGHYNHYQLEAANNSLADSSQVTAALQARILFTMGCHGGLNVADSLGGTGGKYLDWPQLFATKQVAMYLANSGFGYGDSKSNALSERLLSLYAQNLKSDTSSAGEQWVASLQQYFATAGAYDVYDEKVMEEMTFYGLPFWHFSGAVPPPSPVSLITTPDSLTHVQSATVAFPDGTATSQDQFGLYRPILPLKSQEVTSSSLPARGIWVKSLQTNDVADMATLGMPTIDLAAHEPKPNIRPIFFPASPFMLEHSTAFGKRRDYANVSSQFRPDPSSTTGAGVRRDITSASLEIFYSSSTDVIPPLISQVNVAFDGTSSATVQARVTDQSGTVLEVAALVNDGSWQYVQLSRSGDPSVWTGTVAVARDPEVFVEATDGPNVGYSANKGSNFTSASNIDSTRMSFGGFLPPIQNPPTLNLVKAGSSVPIKFSLGGNLGFGIFETGFPESQQVDCQTLQAFGPILTDTAGQSSLSYTASTDQYTYSWKTDPGWVGMCRTLVVQFKDGSQGVADFKLTK
jgi:Mg-chelatase subunit ChlD